MKTNDLNFYPDSPTPATPPAGVSFQDPAFGTQITRVTDRQTGQAFTPQYSAIYDFSNANDTRITFLDAVGGTHWIADVDPDKRTVSNPRRLTKAGPTYWSRVNPDILYVVEAWNQATLSAYDCQAGKWIFVADLSRFQKIAAANTSWVDTRGLSWDDDRFHFSSFNSQSVFIYSRAADNLVGVVKYADAVKNAPALTPYSFNKTQMDAAGRLVLTASEELLINVITGEMFAPKFSTPENIYGDVHPDFDFAGMACGGMGGVDNTGFWPAVVNIDYANLSTYLTKRRRIGPRVRFGVDTHTSARQADGQWITLTHDGAVQPGSPDAAITPIFGDNEIYQLDANSPADGSLNRRICQHHSDPSRITDGNLRYWSSGRGCVSQLGKFIGYNSLYLNDAPDVYIAWIDQPAAKASLTIDQIRAMNVRDFARLIA